MNTSGDPTAPPVPPRRANAPKPVPSQLSISEVPLLPIPTTNVDDNTKDSIKIKEPAASSKKSESDVTPVSKKRPGLPAQANDDTQILESQEVTTATRKENVNTNLQTEISGHAQVSESDLSHDESGHSPGRSEDIMDISIVDQERCDGTKDERIYDANAYPANTEASFLTLKNTQINSPNPEADTAGNTNSDGGDENLNLNDVPIENLVQKQIPAWNRNLPTEVPRAPGELHGDGEDGKITDSDESDTEERLRPAIVPSIRKGLDKAIQIAIKAHEDKMYAITDSSSALTDKDIVAYHKANLNQLQKAFYVTFEPLATTHREIRLALEESKAALESGINSRRETYISRHQQVLTGALGKVKKWTLEIDEELEVQLETIELENKSLEEQQVICRNLKEEALENFQTKFKDSGLEWGKHWEKELRQLMKWKFQDYLKEESEEEVEITEEVAVNNDGENLERLDQFRTNLRDFWEFWARPFLSAAITMCFQTLGFILQLLIMITMLLGSTLEMLSFMLQLLHPDVSEGVSYAQMLFRTSHPPAPSFTDNLDEEDEEEDEEDDEEVEAENNSPS